MYLVSHQDDCQMVVGNILKVRGWDTAEAGAVISVDGTEEDRQLPRQCTCEPLTIKLVRRDGEGDSPHWRIPTVVT